MRSSPLAEAPQLALLSTTVFQSPEVLSVFPVQIRHPGHHDIAFIGQRYVHIKETIHSTGHLQHVAIRSDFDSEIRAAAVFGNAIIEGDRSTRAPSTISNPQRIGQQHSPFPPQGLLLALESAKIVFLTMVRSKSTAEYEFETSSMILPNLGANVPVNRSFPDSLRDILSVAVDLQSRAFALMLRTGRIFFCGCNSQRGTVFPTASRFNYQGLIETDIHISKAEFLLSPPNHDHEAHLLVTGTDGRRPAVKLFVWQQNGNEAPVELKLTPPKAFFDCHSMPQLLIPLMRSPCAFILACQQTISVYADAHLGHLKLIYAKPAHQFDANFPTQVHPGISPARPLWRGWCRPRRTGTNPNRKRRGDALHLTQTETIFNWAPFLDLSFCAARRSSARSNSISTAPGVLVGTSGREPYGGLSELRFGCEAAIDLQIDTVEQTDASHATAAVHQGSDDLTDMRGDSLEISNGSHAISASQVWGFELGDGRMAALLSSPVQSLLLVVHPHSPNDTLSLHPCGDQLLSARKLTDIPRLDDADIFCHVERSRVCFVKIAHESDTAEIVHSQHLPDDFSFAAIDTDQRTVYVAVVNDRTIQSLIFDISEEGKIIASRCVRSENFDRVPTCACLIDEPGKKPEQNNVRKIVAVGTTDQRVYLSMMHGGESNMMAAFQLASAFNDLERPNEAVCASIVALGENKASGCMWMACGLRSGHLIVMDLITGTGEINVGRPLVHKLGNSSIQLSVEDSSSKAIIVSCDNTALRVDVKSLYSNVEFPERRFNIDQIWPTDVNNRSRKIPVSLMSAAQKSSCGSPQPTIVAISPGQVLFGTLDTHPRPLPLRHSLSGTPQRLLFSTINNCFFVITNTTYTHRRDRYIACQILALRTDNNATRQSQPLLTCPPGRSILCVIEWIFDRDGKRYPFLVVGTADKKKEGEQTGCIQFFKVQTEEHNVVALQLIKSYQEEAPVFGICQYDRETLVYCTGNNVKKRMYLPELDRDRRVELMRDTAIAQFVTAHHPYITISFTHGSVRTYRLEGDELELIASDSQERRGLSHLPLTEHKLLLATDKDASVVGLRIPSTNAPDIPRALLFTAKLPASITRICKAEVRPFWKRNQLSIACESQLIGTSPNGSVFAFSVVRLATWRVLRFVQNMCLRHQDICPFSPRAVFERMHIEPASASPSDRQIDGDVLTRLVKHPRAEEILGEMLMVHPQRSASSRQAVDFDSPMARLRRFRELIEDMAQEDVDDGEHQHARSGTKAFTLQVIRQLTENPF
ncbi:MAG: hypothetical protein Q9162_006564 [Coniocarpon cinnabarinum]